MMSILFVTRGRGWGHARRDMLIVDALRQAHNPLCVNIISEAAGYQAYTAYGYKCHQVTTPEEEWRWFLRVDELLSDWGIPDMVVADEHFGGLQLAQELHIPSVFITDWFPVGEFNHPQLIDDFYQADTIIYPGYQSSTPIPKQLAEKVHLVGPIVWPNRYLECSRSELKRTLRLRVDTPLVLVTGGGTPDDVDYFHTCIRAVERLQDTIQLVVVAGSLAESLSSECSDLVRILVSTTEMCQYMAASEVVITRPGHNTLWELAVYGIPSITVIPPRRVNPMPEIHGHAMSAWGYTHTISSERFCVSEVHCHLERLLSSQLIERERLRSLHRHDSRPSAQVACDIILSCMA